MRRREFIGLVAAATVTRPPAAYAQQPARSRLVGVLLGFAKTERDAQSGLAVFREELRKLGWTEGGNIEMEIRAAGADVELMKRFAKELVALQPDLIVTSSTPATAAMLQQTRTIPVIFVEVGDPIGSGFVTSLAQPGGLVTGFTPIVGSLGGKWVEVLRDIAPRLSRVTLVFNPPTAPFVKDYLNPFRAAAASLGMEAIVGPVNDMAELESLFTIQGGEPNSGFVVIPDVFTIGHGAEIISLAARWRVPAIYWSRSFTETGGLISYGPYVPDEYRRAASYVDRILRGAKPSDLPVQAPTKFELVINLKTAKALGLAVPLHLQQLADDVIE
jgi:putative tryptophan/tyrosine transport system substrate-binding protein